jgi:hypothetical protein
VKTLLEASERRTDKTLQGSDEAEQSKFYIGHGSFAIVL